MTGLLLLLSCAGPPPTAVDYCESTVDFFCDYYLRCGRMAEEDDEGCHSTFLEVCNEVYEPHYIALEEAGLLALSEEGMEACAEHLETVTCEQQLFDLDGGCGTMWEGLAPAGGDCGPGIESFVCDAGSTCVLGLDLCGTCEAAAGVGETCGEEVRCRSQADCVDGWCIASALPGEVCSEALGCVSGASCVDDTCVGFGWSEVGQACDWENRCPYRSACVDGFCVQSALLGEGCGDGVTCASGFCEDGTCVELRDDGVSCERADQCVAGRCDETCGGLPGVCFE
ncbi:MAG: hypothetical protein JRI25_11930 [Deltaproteobacteria bacterium]|nr:hypothetical protein [Deltaproteobacteria bacterium]